MFSEPCIHTWEHRPDASGTHAERFECSKCHRWGRRLWTPRGLGALRRYCADAAPNPRWFAARRADEIVDARNASDRGYAELARQDEPMGFARAAYARGMSFRDPSEETLSATI